MDMKEFKALVEAHGANPARWPEDRRAEAEAFAKTENAEVTLILKDAAALDGYLDRAAQVTPSELLIARVMAKAPTSAFSDWRQAAAAAALALIVGTAGGYAGGAFVLPNDTASEYYANAFDGLDTEWELDLGEGA